MPRTKKWWLKNTKKEQTHHVPKSFQNLYRYLHYQMIENYITNIKKITIMKKIWSLLVMAIVAVQFAFAGDIITKDINQLPLAALYHSSGFAH